MKTELTTILSSSSWLRMSPRLMKATGWKTSSRSSDSLNSRPRWEKLRRLSTGLEETKLWINSWQISLKAVRQSLEMSPEKVLAPRLDSQASWTGTQLMTPTGSCLMEAVILNSTNFSSLELIHNLQQGLKREKGTRPRQLLSSISAKRVTMMRSSMTMYRATSRKFRLSWTIAPKKSKTLGRSKGRSIGRWREEAEPQLMTDKPSQTLSRRRILRTFWIGGTEWAGLLRRCTGKSKVSTTAWTSLKVFKLLQIEKTWVSAQLSLERRPKAGGTCTAHQRWATLRWQTTHESKDAATLWNHSWRKLWIFITERKLRSSRKNSGTTKTSG